MIALRKSHPRWSRFIFLWVITIVLGGCASFANEPASTDIESSTSIPSQALFELTKKAELAYQQSRWLEAVRLYQQVVEHAPGDAVAWFRLGNTYAQQGAFERAIHAYEESLSHDSEQPKAWFNLSTAYLLNAQAAMRNAHSRLRDGDPAKSLIEARLKTLDTLVHGRIEEGR